MKMTRERIIKELFILADDEEFLRKIGISRQIYKASILSTLTVEGE